MKHHRDSVRNDINILELISLKIERYLDKFIYISDLIYDLEGYLNQLVTVDNQWKKDFRTVWLDIEIAYSVALDQGLENLTEKGSVLVKKMLNDLIKITQDKINNLKNMKMNEA